VVERKGDCEQELDKKKAYGEMSKGFLFHQSLFFHAEVRFIHDMLNVVKRLMFAIGVFPITG
jgi:hypothetical protein